MEPVLALLTMIGSTIAWFLGRRMMLLDQRVKLLAVANTEADTLEHLLMDLRECHEMGRTMLATQRKMEVDIDDLLRAQQRDKDTHQRMMSDMQSHIQVVEKQYEATLGELYTTKRELMIACERFRNSEEWRIEHEKQHNGG